MENRIKQKNSYQRVILAVFVLVGFSAAGFVWFKKNKEYLNIEDYRKAIQQNDDLLEEKKVNDIIYECKFIPAEFNAVSRLRNDLPESKLKEITAASLGFVYFKLSLKSVDVDHPVLDPVALGPEEYNSRIRFFNAYAQEHIKLIYGSDTMKCNQYVFENPYNLKKDVNLMLAFKIPDQQPAKDIQLIYDDQLFNNGLVKFYYSRQQIQELPELIINK